MTAELSVLELLPGTGSVVVADTVAVLTAGPVKSLARFTVIVKLLVVPAGSEPR